MQLLQDANAQARFRTPWHIRALFQPLLSTIFEQQYIPGTRPTLTEAHRVWRDQMVGMVFREFVRGWMRMQKQRLPAAVFH